MKKKAIVVAAASLLLTAGLTTTPVSAAHLTHLTRTSYIYNSKGKRLRTKLHKGKYLKVYRTKNIKGKKYYRIGKNKYIRFSNFAHLKDNESYTPVGAENVPLYLNNHSDLPTAKSVVTNAKKLPKGTKFAWNLAQLPEFKHNGNTTGEVKITYPDGSKDTVQIDFRVYGTDHIKLPTDYTLTNLQAAEDTPTTVMIEAAKKGAAMDENQFVPESQADDQEKVDINNLTPKQKARISQFALRIINEARFQIGRPDWQYTAAAQKLADDVAHEYQTHHRGIQDEDHYVVGLEKAAKENGITISGNEIEDMYGDTAAKPKTMTELKNLVYNGITAFLFNPQEFHHAADILSAHRDKNWNKITMTSPFAISFTYVGDWNSVHYISIPSGKN
ncbi:MULTISPECIES: SEC10/PgrA surface exclusion domain-containing protein [Lactobacillus]|uniref:SEC10/PgrA surface exclusion domain-containing protein n=1 Tax=Lactobacillus xujianguonis TaxID=2495899 RepID=A0A437SVR2_9LACO|nr:MULTISPECIES: SEC10/PgrA surface exclusion domain-containing protein [Lactobacillus]RVU71015.1 SEC10/PgrA surface exclusion domain-containing protein [Lactobacillus xujianguonis]RVU73915.1 SEC10/PgrA surface exclusion domain-containing protein [Lactobacillus xujianguonis]